MELWRSVSVALPPIGVLFPLRALSVIPAPSAFLLSPLNPVTPVNSVKNQPVPSPPLALRVSDTMAVRQNTVRKSATAGRAASCRAAFGAAWLLPLLGEGSLGGREALAAKNAKKRKESAQPAPIGVQWFHD